MDIFLNVSAGLGLFVIGTRLIGTHLGQIAGRRMRLLIGRAMEGRRTATSLGLLLGAVMQNANAVILTLGNLVQAGVLDARRAQPVIAMANLGMAVVVLVASVSLHGLALLLLAFIGLAFHLSLQDSPRWRPAVWALLGLGLMILGLDFIRTAAADLKSSDWLAQITGEIRLPLVLHFLIGFLVTLVVQSSSVIAIVAMTVAKAGLIDLPHGACAVLGACLASGFTALFVGSHLYGKSRQLLLYQLALKVAGVAATSLLLVLELYLGLPLMFAAAAVAGLTIDQMLAMLYIVVHLLSDLALHPVHGPLNRWLARRAPESEEEQVARAQFLNEDGLAEPETALLLLEREQLILLDGMTDYVDGFRKEAQAPRVSLQARHLGSQRLLAECQDFLTALSGRHRSMELLEDILRHRGRLEICASLHETLWNFHAELARLYGAAPLEGFVHAMLESTHLLLWQLSDSAREAGTDSLEQLALLTQDRSDMMDDVRRRAMGLSGQVPAELQKSLLDATMFFERQVWLIGRYTKLLQARPVMADAAA